MKRIVLAMTVLCVSAASMASTIGLSTQPMGLNKRVLTTEFNTYMASALGMGVTAKYFQRVNGQMNFDAGVGIGSGDRTNVLSAGADFEIFPDYGRQPRVSTKAFFQSASIKQDRVNNIGAAPTISKGFAFWGNEAFPFVALPMGLALNTDKGTYETVAALSAGITGRIPVEGYRHLLGNIETNIDLRNSYTAIVMGVSMPLQ